MEIWRPGKTSSSLQESEITIEGIGTFHRASINRNKSFPYLDIQISWNDEGKPHFNVYKKPGDFVKYLNSTTTVTTTAATRQQSSLV
jgi:hypothetical protein